MATIRLATGQAIIEYLARQHVERDGVEHRFFAGLWGIFGHGNIGGVAQAIQQVEADFPYYLTRNEQAPVPRMDEPVDPGLVDELRARIPDFRPAHEPDGMTADAFDRHGATVRTLRAFIASYHDLIGAVRDIALPDPDARR